MTKNKAAFIDRDGVINVERNYVGSLEEFKFIDGAIAGLRLLQLSGYLVIVITNQAGIARGYYSEKDFHELTSSMNEMLAEHGVEIAEVYYCPHHPVAGIGLYKQDCNCRKPKPGMILDAVSKYKIDLTRSVLVGDKVSDIQSGLDAGIKNNILVKSGHELGDFDGELAMATCTDLFQAAQLIVSENRLSSNVEE